MRGLFFVKNVESKKEGQEINPVPLSSPILLLRCTQKRQRQPKFSITRFVQQALDLAP
jgi:hypothetical protein